MVAQAGEVAARAQRTAPRRSGHKAPPQEGIDSLDRPVGRSEDGRAGVQQVGTGVRIVGRVRRAFGQGAVVRIVHEARELGVGHRGAVDHEGVDGNAAGRRLLGIVVVRAHPENGGRDLDHGGAARAQSLGGVQAGVPPDAPAARRSRRASPRPMRMAQPKLTSNAATAYRH